MVTIPLSGGPPKRRIIEMAYAKCGLAGYELGRTPEEVNDAQSELNAMMLEWPFCCLGYEQPDYGLGHPDDCSGIPAETLAAVATQLALRLAPNMGKTLSPEAHGSVSRSMSLLYAKVATVPTQPLQSNTPRGMGRNRGVSFSNPFINEDYASPGGCLPIIPALRGIIKRGGSVSPPPPPPPTAPTLVPLALSASSIIENSVVGTIVGTILNATFGSTLSLGNSAGSRFALSGNLIVAGTVSTDYETATSHNITIVETLAGATGSPNSTTLAINVVNVSEQPNLAALTFSAGSFTTGVTSSGAILGATAGSSIAASGLPSGLTINGAARTWAWDGTGSIASGTFTLTETLLDSANSPRTSTINYTISAPNTLATPTVANAQAINTIPLDLYLSTTDYVAGDFVQWEMAGSLTPAKNGDGSYTTTIQSGTVLIDGASFGAGVLHIGVNDPAGPYAFHERIARDNESVAATVPGPSGGTFQADVSAWSNDYTDTISVSSAALNTVNGVNKNSNITISGGGLTFVGTNGVGGAQPDRTTIQAQSDYTYFEVTISAISSGSSFLYVGYCNTTDNFASGIAPGHNSSNGICFKLASNQIFLNWNSDGNGVTLSTTAGILAVGDIVGFRLKKSTNQVEMFRIRSGVTTPLNPGGTPITIPAFASYYAYVAPTNNEGGTCNFGASTFARTLGSETYFG